MSTQTEYAASDPRSRPPEAWNGRLGWLASQRETDGPRVEECRRALAWWAAHRLFSAEIDRGAMTVELAEQMLDMLRTRGAAS